MITAFASNLGMGSRNLAVVEPSRLLILNFSAFAFYDRIYIDEYAFRAKTGQDGRQFLVGLVEAGVVEPVGDIYSDGDVRAAMQLFCRTHNTEVIKRSDGRQIDCVGLGEIEFQRELDVISEDALYGFLRQLEAYCAVRAAAKLGCPIIGHDPVDLKLRNEAMEHIFGVADAARFINPFTAPLMGMSKALGINFLTPPLTVRQPGSSVVLQTEVEPDHPLAGDLERRFPRGVDSVESGRRFEAFLTLRRSPYFKACQTHLLTAGDDTDYHERTVAAAQRDWEALGVAMDDDAALQRFADQHPEHHWWVFMKRDWPAMTTVREARAPVEAGNWVRAYFLNPVS